MNWGLSRSTQAQLFQQHIFRESDLSEHTLESLTGLLDQVSMAELMLAMSRRKIVLEAGDIDCWRYSPPNLDEYAGVNFHEIRWRECASCEDPIEAPRVYCSDCLRSGVTYEWCVECDAPGKRLCDDCKVRLNLSGLEKLDEWRKIPGGFVDDPFPEALLREYEITDMDCLVAENYARKVLSENWLHWDNRQQIIESKLNAGGAASTWWNQRFPEFDAEIARWSFEEEDPGASGLTSAWIGAILLALILWPLFPVSIIMVRNAQRAQQEQYRPSYSPTKLRDTQWTYLSEMKAEILRHAERIAHETVTTAAGGSREDWANSVSNRWQPLAPRPALPARDLSPGEAEEYVTQLMKYFGLPGVQKTRQSRDGGIDVESELLVAQVKHQVAPVGVKVVRELYGVASHRGKSAAVFTKTGFTREAVEFANETGVFLFTYIPELGGATELTRRILRDGLLPTLTSRS